MSDRKKVLLVFGTRPEAIKLAPIIKALKQSKTLETIICVTAQHREMLDQILDVFSIKPDIDLDIMKHNQDLFMLTARVLEQVGRVIETVKPDIVLIQGDTTTVMASSLAAFYAKVPVGHVEAGLRTHERYSPFPEEINRQLTGVLSSYHFTPTEISKKNLMAENIPEKNIFVTGNTVVDAVLEIAKKVKESDQIKKMNEKFNYLDKSRRIVLITGHRRENFGESFKNICLAFRDLALKFPEIDFLYPVHLNPNVKKPVNEIIGYASLPNFYLTEPQEYLPFIYLMNKASLIITDSGGIQEEAPSLGKNVVVTRETTERPEGLKTGLVTIVGKSRKKIIDTVSNLLNNKGVQIVEKVKNPYGDGKAGIRIVKIVETLLA